MVKDCSFETHGLALGNDKCARAKARGGSAAHLRDAARLSESQQGLFEVGSGDTAERKEFIPRRGPHAINECPDEFLEAFAVPGLTHRLKFLFGGCSIDNIA